MHFARAPVRRLIQSQKVKAPLHGLSQGWEVFEEATTSSVSDLWRKPLVGLRRSGVRGAASGAATGFMSSLSKPLSASFFLMAKVRLARRASTTAPWRTRASRHLLDGIAGRRARVRCF